MVDSDAHERKLRPIYDAIDARNYKAAIKASDAALKKYKNDQLVRALKAFALVKTEKHAEAMQLLEGIVDEVPASERVLNTMTYAFKAANSPTSAITAAYAAAVERRPKDLAALEGLFGCYVREGSFIRQQQVATKLLKLVTAQPACAGDTESSNARYGWWVVCSLVLQCRAALASAAGAGASSEDIGASSGGLAVEKLLQLAATMAARQVERAGGAPSYEALLLYLDVLQGQGRADKALELLEGPTGERCVPLAAERLQLHGAAALRCGNAAAAAACYRRALLKDPDDWQSWRLYLDSLLPGSADAPGVAMAAPSGSRFPAGVVGGLADLLDRHGVQAQAQDTQQRGAADSLGAAGAAEAAEGMALAAAEATLSELQAAVAASETWRAAAAAGSLRTPALAPLELLLRRVRLAERRCSNRDEVLQQLAAAVAEAYRHLGHTFSCVPDLRPYLAVLAPSRVHAAWLASELQRAGDEVAAPAQSAAAGGAEATAGDAAAAPGPGAVSESGCGSGHANGKSRAGSEEVKQLQRVVNALLLDHELGLPVFESVEEAEAYSVRLLRLYEQQLPLSGSLDEKERGYGEELVAMAASTLLQAGRMSSGGQGLGLRMVQALLVLEAAQVRRSVSAPFRLACTALCGLLLAPSAAAQHFSALDVKHILHDSLTGHWLLPALLGGAADGELSAWLGGIATLHDDHQKDAGDTLLLAYQHGTYSKVLEFVDFQDRLLRSHTRLIGRAEGVVLALRRAAVSGGGAEALREAAAAAAERLEADPLAPLLSCQPDCRRHVQEGDAAVEERRQGQVVPEQDGVVRFNEDLATRPAWLPPHPGPARDGVAAWWEQQQQQAKDGQGEGRASGATGYAGCWWSQVAAAESRAPSAAAWRRSQLAALRRRWALPAVLAAALASQPTAVQLQLLQSCSQDWEAPEGARDHATLAATDQLGSLHAALLAAAHAVQSAAAALDNQREGAPGVDAVLACLSALSQRWGKACEAAVAGLTGEDAGTAPLGLPLPAGRGAALAAALLCEEAAWAAACLQAWTCRGLRVAADGKSGEAQATARLLLDSMRSTARAVTGSIEGVTAVLSRSVQTSQQEQTKAVAAALDLFGAASTQSRPLWSFEPEFRPLEVVRRLVGEQRAMVARLQAGANAALAMLGSSIPG